MTNHFCQSVVTAECQLVIQAVMILSCTPQYSTTVSLFAAQLFDTINDIRCRHKIWSAPDFTQGDSTTDASASLSPQYAYGVIPNTLLDRAQSTPRTEVWLGLTTSPTSTSGWCVHRMRLE
jgi:hypothetical protein